MIEGIMLGLSIFAFVFLLISVVLMVRLKKQEIHDVVLLFSAGLVFIAIVSLVDILFYIDRIFEVSFINMSLLIIGVKLVIVPLAALCFLAALFVLKEYR